MTDHAPAALTFENSPEWIRVDDAARLACVTTRTIRRWDHAGLIRTSRPAGGRVLVNRDSLRALIEAGASGGEAA